MPKTSMRPPSLSHGDHVRVVAPSRSLAMIGADIRRIADQRFEAMGLRLSFGDHVNESDAFASTSIKHRVEDLHAAFADPEVQAILTVVGGTNSNQLLPHLDWDLIGSNPKIFCGYSDITALSCAMHAHTGLITYSGPHYSTFGMEQHFDDTHDGFTAALFDTAPLYLEPSSTWTDDRWFLDQHDRVIQENEGYWILGVGEASGPLIGGNLCTFNLLHGTDHMPDIRGSILFIEDDFLSVPETFDRDLTSLTQQPGFEEVSGLLIGRFQRAVNMSRAKLTAILAANERLARLPTIANVDFGHTDPLATIPLGEIALIDSREHGATITIRPS